ncbi:MAG: polyhydroxyalkanoic acid system family protein [Bdellovibrionales bacterium]|nr:polyhydroxyalkanoic acid system family protein [Bdellovibrionales bacterium]
MPKVNIDYNSPLNADDTFAKVKDLLNNDESLRKIDSTIQCEFNDGQRTGIAKGSKFKAEMAVADSGSSSQVTIIVDLPLMLGAFKGQVKSTIERKLSKILA